MVQYNEERFGGLFQLRNDGEYADVIFLYQDVTDVLVAETHYIKSADYNGYVHCLGRGCPACAKNIRTQTKLFVPMYNIQQNEIQFWDRTMYFEQQLMSDVFQKFSNPSEYVFRITRHGVARDVNTHYSITAIGKNTMKPYAQILAENNATMPEYYSNVCKEVTLGELTAMLNADAAPAATGGFQQAYQATPRQTTPVAPSMPAYEPPKVDVPAFNQPPVPGVFAEEAPELPFDQEVPPTDIEDEPVF